MNRPSINNFHVRTLCWAIAVFGANAGLFRACLLQGNNLTQVLSVGLLPVMLWVSLWLLRRLDGRGRANRSSWFWAGFALGCALGIAGLLRLAWQEVLESDQILQAVLEPFQWMRVHVLTFLPVDNMLANLITGAVLFIYLWLCCSGPVLFFGVVVRLSCAGIGRMLPRPRATAAHIA